MKIHIKSTYIATTTLLLCHQIDATYWKEWEMFSLPFGYYLYLLFNLAVIPVLLVGLTKLDSPGEAFVYTNLCGLLGVITFVIHLVFWLIGFEQFLSFVSILVLCLCLISGAFMLLTNDSHKLSRPAKLMD